MAASDWLQHARGMAGLIARAHAPAFVHSGRSVQHMRSSSLELLTEGLPHWRLGQPGGASCVSWGTVFMRRHEKGSFIGCKLGSAVGEREAMFH